MTFYDSAIAALSWAKTVANSKVAITALNTAKYLTRSGTYSYRDDALNHMSAKERAAGALEYSASVGLDGKMPAAEGFKTYATNRIGTVDKFTSVKIDGKSLPELLNVTRDTNPAKQTAITYVTSAVNEALKFGENITRKVPADQVTAGGPKPGARQQFEDDMADLKKCLDDPTFRYLPGSLTDYLFHIKGNAVGALKEQQDLEVENLEELFKDKVFCDNLRASVGLTDTQEDEFKQVKDDMVGALKQSQAEQLAAFEQSVNGPLTNMFEQSKERVAFLAMIDKISQNRSAIDKLVLAGGNLTAGQGSAANAKSDRFSGVKIGDLKQIMTASGRTLNSTGENNYTLSLPNRLLRPDFYVSSSNNRKESIMMMPLALKAQGCDEVTMTINHPNKEYAKLLAREAYEACREAGFETKDIKIVMNDEVFSEEKTGEIRSKLFSDCGSRFDAAEAQAHKNATDWERARVESEAAAPRKPITEFKATVDDCRQAQRKAEAAAAAEQAPSASAPTL